MKEEKYVHITLGFFWLVHYYLYNNKKRSKERIFFAESIRFIVKKGTKKMHETHKYEKPERTYVHESGSSGSIAGIVFVVMALIVTFLFHK